MVDNLLVLLVGILLVYLPPVVVLRMHPAFFLCLCRLLACGCPCSLSHPLVVLLWEASLHMPLVGLHKLVVLRMLVVVDMPVVVHMLVVAHMPARLVGLLLWLVPLLQIAALWPLVLLSPS